MLVVESHKPSHHEGRFAIANLFVFKPIANLLFWKYNRSSRMH